MKTRPKGAGSIPLEREPADGVARLRLGSYEFKKKGVSRFDLRDPYHLAVALSGLNSLPPCSRFICR